MKIRLFQLIIIGALTFSAIANEESLVVAAGGTTQPTENTVQYQTLTFPNPTQTFTFVYKGHPLWSKITGEGIAAILYKDKNIYVSNYNIIPFFAINRVTGKDLLIINEFVNGRNCNGVFRVISYSASTDPEISKLIGNCSVPTIIINTSNTILEFDNNSKCSIDASTGKLTECTGVNEK